MLPVLCFSTLQAKAMEAFYFDPLLYTLYHLYLSMYERIKMFHLINPLWREGVGQLGASGNRNKKLIL